MELLDIASGVAGGWEVFGDLAARDLGQEVLPRTEQRHEWDSSC